MGDLLEMMASMLQTQRLSSKASLSEARRSIRAALQRAGVDASQCFDCLVAVTEACTNALEHGRSADADEPDPEVSWRIGPDGASFEVRDFSTRRWSRAAHPARGPGDTDGRPSGGFGIELMHELMDEVTVDSSPQGTSISLVKRFAP